MHSKFIASSLPLLVAACASLQKPTPTVNVPDKLKPPANESHGARALTVVLAIIGVIALTCGIVVLYRFIPPPSFGDLSEA